jgi:hypothetical protein
VADTSKGFRPRYRISGGDFTIQSIPFKDTETLTKGDILNLETGEVDLGATNDTTFIGVALETKAGTDSTTLIKVITDFDAVYGVYDANARYVGETLDIAGATGAMTVATSSNVDLIVVAPSTAAEETLVRFAQGEHYQFQ